MEVVPAHFGSERVDLVATRGLEFGEPHHEPCLWHQYRVAWQISLRPSETWGFTYIWLIGNTIGSPWYSIHGGYGENNSSIRIWLDNEYLKSLGEFRSTRRSHLALVYEIQLQWLGLRGWLAPPHKAWHNEVDPFMGHQGFEGCDSIERMVVDRWKWCN